MSDLARGELRGVPAAPGAGLGPAWRPPAGAAHPAGGADEEARRAQDGLDAAAARLEARAAALEAAGSPEEAEIVRTNALLAADPTLLDGALARTGDGAAAGAAVLAAAEEQAALLAALDDELLALRADDVRAVGRLAAALADGQDPEPPAGAVVVADDLGPGEVADAAGRVAALALAAGGPTAHAAIVARSLGVPLVTGLGAALAGVEPGEPLAVDADAGVVWRRPDEPTRVAVEARARRAAAERERDLAERTLPSETRDGVAVALLANAGTAAEVAAALRAGAAGIGLLRTELSFLEAHAWPTEAEHLRVLRPLLAPLGGRTATVRILDYGGDKTPPFLQRPGSDAFLAPRGVRLLLAAPEALDAQLRALIAAAGEAQLRILVPMVTDAADLDAVRAAAEEARAAVAPDGPPVRVGAMVEVPAAALLAEHVAAAADFLSIGTNDLVQYTLAAARLEGDERGVAHHPAMLRLIGRVGEAAAARGIPLEVCGEAAGDPRVLPLLIGLGVGELSVSPGRVGQTRRLIRAVDAQRARAAARAALLVATPAEAEALAREVLPPGDDG